MIATAPSLVTLRTDDDTGIMKRFELELTYKETRSTYIAPAITKLLAAFEADLINQFLPNVPTNVFTVPVSTV
jgi:hypothetical protein